MDVVDAPLEVFFVADSMFPIPSLPDSPLPMADTGVGLRTFFTTSSQPASSEFVLESSPA